MDAFTIAVDGIHLLTVNLEGMHLFHVSISSSLHEAAAATLEVHGGTYGDEVDGHRIWVSNHALLPGQSVTVGFAESTGPFSKGATMHELFPDDESSEAFDFTITNAKAAELRTRPTLRESFSMNIAKNSGAQCVLESSPNNDQFTFMILWDQWSPLQARLSARTYCFEDVIARQSGNDHLRATLSLGESATCQVG